MDDEESWLYGGGGEDDQAGEGEDQSGNQESGSKDAQEVRKYVKFKSESGIVHERRHGLRGGGGQWFCDYSIKALILKRDVKYYLKSSDVIYGGSIVSSNFKKVMLETSLWGKGFICFI